MFSLWKQVSDLTENVKMARVDIARLERTVGGAVAAANRDFESFRAEMVLFRSEVLDALARIETAVTPSVAASIRFFTELDGKLIEVNSMQMKVTQKIPLSIKPVDKFGNDAKLDGVPAWALSDPSKGSLAVAADGLSGEFVPAGAVGSLEIQVSGDADLGEGVVPIMGSLPVDLLPGDAVAIQVAAGPAVDA